MNAAERAALVAARERVLAHLKNTLITRLHLEREPDELDPDVPLFGSGFGLDSLDAVELVVTLESELGVKITDRAAIRGAMRSLNTLADLVLAHEAQHAHP